VQPDSIKLAPVYIGDRTYGKQIMTKTWPLRSKMEQAGSVWRSPTKYWSRNLLILMKVDPGVFDTP
jgi:hypothetical protein